MTIEGSWGLGSAVVGGEVTPDRWVLGKITGDISVRDISEKLIQHAPLPGGGTEHVPVAEDLRRTPCMSDAELQGLRAVARKVEPPEDVGAHLDAGANHVCLQPVGVNGIPRDEWTSLALALS